MKKLMHCKQNILVLGVLVFQMIACGGGGGDPEPPPGNNAPTANGGMDQQVIQQSLVSLTGTASDTDGTVASFAWSQSMGEAVTFITNDGAVATFNAPMVTELVVLTFELRVTDDDGATGRDTVQISVLPQSEVEMRSFHMGFTAWTHEATLEALDLTYERIATHGDITGQHFMGGIPWQAALGQTTYPDDVTSQTEFRSSKMPSGIPIYFALDSLNGGRDSLVDNWGVSENETRSGDWSNRSWNDQEVIDAYVNFAGYLIDTFNPEYFNYGTEVSELIINDINGYYDFLIFAEQVYTRLKATYPNVVFMVSVALKHPGSNQAVLLETELAALMPYADAVGISAYPFIFYDQSNPGDPDNLPVAWLSQINNISMGKPIAVTETGWAAENVDIPSFGVDIAATDLNQQNYLNHLFTQAEQLDLEFVIWFSITDYDVLWNDSMGQDPIARIWRDTGMYDENQQARVALTTWEEWLTKTKVILRPK